MKARIEAVVRAIRSLVQGAWAAGVLAAVMAAQTVIGDGQFEVRVVVIAVVSAFVTAAVSYVLNAVRAYLGASSPAVEAIIRAARTLLAGALSVGIIAGGEAVVAAVQGGTYSPWVVGAAAWSAVATAVVSFVHNAIKPRTVAA